MGGGQSLDNRGLRGREGRVAGDRLVHSPCGKGGLAMMRPRQMAQGALFCEFSIEDHVPPDHLLRSMDRFVDRSAHLTGGPR